MFKKFSLIVVKIVLKMDTAVRSLIGLRYL